ncbi:MAG: endolytic transglycosylase MltG [Minicystis sp.]
MPADRSPPRDPRRKKRPPRSRKGDGSLRARLKNLSPRTRAVLWAFGSLVATLALAAGALLLGYGRSGGHTPGRTVEVDWPAGLSAEDAAAHLAELGLVESRDTMAIFLRATGGTDDFIPGPHLLYDGATPWDLRRMLSRSFLRPMARITVPEGFNRFDIAARLEKLHIAGRKAFLAASADPALLAELGISAPGMSSVESAEGYLFPATYDFGKDSDPKEIVRRLVAESDKRWQALSAKHADSVAKLQASLGWGRRELVIVASLIEKEAAVDEDRPLIASVFVNRLTDPEFKPKRLQSDPSSAYGCIAFPQEAPSCADFAGKPTPAINRDAKNRYSTYAHNGLPPGPIANPGAKSLEAAVAPAATRYFYFVHAGGGRHAFSETLDAHNDAVHRPTSDAGRPTSDAGRAP